MKTGPKDNQLEDHSHVDDLAKRADLLLKEALKWHSKYVAMEHLLHESLASRWAELAQVESPNQQ